ncbi:MAG: hypothetical protein ACRYG4_21650 [Janthinobacterium lividum]
MTHEQISYFERRAEEEARIAAETNDAIIRETHEHFAKAYTHRVAQAKVARATVEEMLG